MESTASRVDEIDIVEVYHSSVWGNERKIDKNISVQATHSREYDDEPSVISGREEDEALTEAIVQYYYNFRPYVVDVANDEPFYLDSEPAGTLLNPNLELLLAHSQPAPFGRREETVFDESVRRAKSIPGDRLTKKYESLTKLRDRVVWLAQKLYIGQDVTPVLSKLHIYEEGGHFHPHRDTLRSEDHVGSIVVLLGTPFTGGEFFINDEHCPLEVDCTKSELPLVAFYTDIVHEVRPVTSGVRVSLQFDVFASAAEVKSCAPCVYDFLPSVVSGRGRNPGTPFVDEERCDAVVAEISARLSSTPNLIIPTYHRYPQPALHKNTLKPIDELLLRKLVEQGYSVTPVPLNLVEEYDQETSCATGVGASLFWQPPFNEGKPAHAPAGTQFVILPQIESLVIYGRDYIEFTGNEAELGQYAYYLSGLLISAAETTKRVKKTKKRQRGK